VLTKKYVVNPDLLDDKAPALSKCEGCEIQWKEGKDLTVTEVKKKQKAKSGKNKGQVRMVTSTEPKASFFWFFAQPLTEEEEMELQEKEEEPESVKLTMEDDYEVGHSIRTSVVPEAVLWYTGEAMEDEDDDDDDEVHCYHNSSSQRCLF
jgi:nucleosome assembly protein 1-like 1